MLDRNFYLILVKEVKFVKEKNKNNKTTCLIIKHVLPATLIQEKHFFFHKEQKKILKEVFLEEFSFFSCYFVVLPWMFLELREKDRRIMKKETSHNFFRNLISHFFILSHY